MSRTKRDILLWYLIFPTTVALVLAYSFGFIPERQIVHLSNWSSPSGYGSCAKLTERILVTGCEFLAHPVGTVTFEGATTRTLAYWIGSLSGLSYYASFQLIGIALIALCAMGCIGLSSLTMDKYWPGALVAILYLFSHASFIQPGIPQVTHGALLLPFGAWILLYQLQYPTTLSRLSILISTSISLGIIVINVSGYAYLFLLAVVALLGLAMLYLLRITEPYRFLQRYAVALGGLLLAGTLQRYLFLPETSLKAMPLSFYRGSSIDLLAFLIPREGNFLWSNLLPGDLLLSNASNLVHHGRPFLGYITVILVISTLIVSQATLKRHIVGFVLICGVFIFVSLGPSLRISDPWPIDHTGAIRGFDARLMPSDQASLELPWKNIYKQPPLAFARAVYRWQIPLELVLSLLIASSASELISRASTNKARIPILLLIGLVILESMRPTLWSSGADYISRYRMVDHFKTHVLQPLDKELPDNARVLYLPAENDHLAPAVGPLINIRTYNISGDKNTIHARDHQPKSIRTAIREYNKNPPEFRALSQLFIYNKIDALVLNHFSLRWSSYRWPPPATVRRDLQQKSNSLSTTLQPYCAIERLQYSTIIANCNFPHSGRG